MKQRLLFITHHRLCDKNGGSNASKSFLHAFATLFDNCAVLCPAFEGSTTPYIPDGVKIFHPDDHRSNPRKLVDMYRGVISPLYDAVHQHLRTHQYDIIVIDHSFSGAGVVKYIKSTGAKLITIHHNVECDYLRDNSKERPLFYRYPFLYYSKKAERDSLKASDLNLTVTKRDAEVFQSWYQHIPISHWGIFEYLPLPDKSFASKEKGEVFVITGSLQFEQSLRPILDFVRRNWPLVRQTCASAKLLIAGSRPAVELQELCANTDGVTLIPNPDDIGAVVQKADYYICPIHAGSGLKLRIYDGLKQGLPVLCHDVSAAGYEALADGGCLFSYHDENTFIHALQKIQTTKVPPQSVYQIFRETFSLETGIAKLERLLKKNLLI